MTPDKLPALELNQSSLQDFSDCSRRFELRFIEDAIWPAATSSPLSKYESLTELGTQFHQLCQQFFIGLDPGLITSSIMDPDLRTLWDAFYPFGSSLKAHPHFTEQILRVPFAGNFLSAKFDLIVQLPDNQYLIVDWKTASQKPSRNDLGNRVQTYLYPFIFHQAGGDLFDVPAIHPSSIRMQYWYPLVDDPEESFPYSEPYHEQVARQISELVSRIDQLRSQTEAFPLTEDHSRCKYCVFRSFCERSYETSPALLGADLSAEDLSNTYFDYGLIKEIEF